MKASNKEKSLFVRWVDFYTAGDYTRCAAALGISERSFKSRMMDTNKFSIKELRTLVRFFGIPEDRITEMITGKEKK